MAKVKFGGPRQIAVIGLGRFGASLARSLIAEGYEVLGIDSDEKLVQELSGELTHVVQADATEEEVLRSLGLRNFDITVIAIGNHLEASLLTTMIAKDLGAGMVVAKAGSDLHAKLLEKLGVDRVVFPERDMGARVAKSLVTANLLDCIDISDEYSIAELRAPRGLIGKSLKELDLRARNGLNVLAIRHGETLNVSPGADDRIEEGDVILVLGAMKAIERLEEMD